MNLPHVEMDSVNCRLMVASRAGLPDQYRGAGLRRREQALNRRFQWCEEDGEETPQTRHQAR